jgi:uncharacterized protein (TIGR02588 family)
VNVNLSIESQPHDSIPLLEWVISGFGLLLVAASLCFLLYKAILVDPQPPIFEAQLLETRARECGGFVSTIEIANRGGRTAAKVRVLIEMAGQAGSDLREFEVDYLPPQSTRQVSVLFGNQPSTSNLKIEFASYCDP